MALFVFQLASSATVARRTDNVKLKSPTACARRRSASVNVASYRIAKTSVFHVSELSRTAFLGQYCVKDEQCHLSDLNSKCHFIVRGVYGRCQCAFGSGSDGKCLPGECREDAECQRTHPQALCKDGICQCPNGRCTDVAALPVKIRPVSLGKSCVSHSQCQARDQHSRCEGGRCECAIDTPTCSSVNTRCLNDTFQCTSGQCISWYFVCDGEKNCLDGTDEENCTPFVVGRGGCQLRCRPRHLTMVQNDVAKSPRAAEQCDVNIHSFTPSF
ncbi:low-density lipoprotein receptor-related protein [Trichonephila clavipes]|uniref:Low-density lipoprotein receptor-related protein n=1 Tax=Trichonephila clavipes TaxID=2585209 RepID=A0A8X7BDX0_TRICX|nr:low-density lipoprotein receptor-related protein [Trichonephila clavipes]